MTTNFATACYQEIFDLNTRDQKVTFLGIHTPTGSKPRQMLEGFFMQFRKFKYKGCNVKLVPCATLPVDPLGVSYEAGSQTVDAREMVNPILFKGCHGESLGGVLNQLYKNAGFTNTGNSIDESGNNQIDVDPYNYAEQLYYAGLSDKSFKKFGIQSGLSVKGLHPLVHTLAMNHPMLPDSAQPDRGKLFGDNASGNGGVVWGGYDKVWNGDIVSPTNPTVGLSPATDMMFTSGVKSLGWLPTRSLAQYPSTTTSEAGTPKEVFSYLPKLMMGLICLPPCYSVKMYFRCIISHYFEFKDFTSALQNNLLPTYNYENAMDGPISAVAQMMMNEDMTIESDSMDISPTTSGVF